ncbi:hypothetical protein LTR01_000238 [Friedmanniomyces endolithicus]|nr:hypothetical protein LTS09_012169 [Friedmanniomyces endolithicus]KAK0316490.1 hypothetical protein LTR01_000238 [Friedmanniomyces endolithicus]KAK0834666.1 hypothetical protein LTR73_000955 [Friedmanniomyces endolithicus]
MPRMPSSILVGISLPLWLSVVAAQNFIPLSNYTDYGSLQQCQMVCLNGGAAYDDPKTAQASCGNLINQLNGVDGCVVNSLASQCSANATAAYGAKSILAAYCTTEIALEGVNIPSTTVLPPTSSSSGDSQTSSEASGTSIGAATTVAGVSGAAATGDGGPGVTASTTNAPQTGTPSAGPVAPTATLHDAGTAVGLTSGAKAGIGVGVALAILLVIGAIAAWWFLSKRKKSRVAGGPYGPVMTNEKGQPESGSYSGPHMDMQDMHSMAPAAPFLPIVATHDLPRHEDAYEPTPTSIRPGQVPYSDDPAPGPAYLSTRSSPQREHYILPLERPATSRDVSRGGTPPSLNMQTRPATAHPRVSRPDDEPPSPVSPISPAGSRPGSLRHDLERHD